MHVEIQEIIVYAIELFRSYFRRLKKDNIIHILDTNRRLEIQYNHFMKSIFSVIILNPKSQELFLTVKL